MNEPLEVDVSTVKRWLAERGDLVLLDCREPSEAATAAIEGSILIPMQQLPAASDQLKQMAGKHVVVHCHHGGRSLRVTHWLRANGFPSAQSMAGGIDAWSIEIDPEVPRY